jgi:LCCL domain
MQAIRLMVLSAVLLGRVPVAHAQADLPAAAKEVVKQFEEEAVEFEKKTEAEVKKRWEKTTAELKKVQDALCKEAKLDEAVAVRDLLRAIQAGTNVTPSADLPAAAQEVYKQHEEEVAEIHKKAEADFKNRREKTIAELKKVQDAFCKEAKLDEAVAVRELIRAIRDGAINALPDPGYVNNKDPDIGKVFYYEATGIDVGQSIYGTDVYTTGSHLGMAGVHCGLLKVGQKGILKVTILPGQADYGASTRNGVTSIAYGAWSVSFKVERVRGFVGKAPVGALPDPGILGGHRADIGKILLFEVTGSNTGSVWGQDIYTDDSSLATAAVHAGVLAVGQKGIVKVTILPGQESYESSTRNGISSGNWGSWTGSFRVERAR